MKMLENTGDANGSTKYSFVLHTATFKVRFPFRIRVVDSFAAAGPECPRCHRLRNGKLNLREPIFVKSRKQRSAFGSACVL